MNKLPCVLSTASDRLVALCKFAAERGQAKRYGKWPRRDCVPQTEQGMPCHFLHIRAQLTTTAGCAAPQVYRAVMNDVAPVAAKVMSSSDGSEAHRQMTAFTHEVSHYNEIILIKDNCCGAGCG